MRKTISSLLAATLIIGSIGVAAAEPGAGINSVDRNVAAPVAQSQTVGQGSMQAGAGTAQDWTANQTLGK